MAALTSTFALLAASFGLVFLGDVAAGVAVLGGGCFIAIMARVAEVHHDHPGARPLYRPRSAGRPISRVPVKQPDDVIIQKRVDWDASLRAYVTTFDVVCPGLKARGAHFISVIEATGRAKAFAVRHRVAMWFEADPETPAVFLESFRKVR